MVAMMGVFSCGGAQSSGQSDLVNVDIVGLVFGPSLSDGTYWDANELVPDSIRSDLNSALASVNPYVPVAELLTEAVLAGTKAPDPYGFAELAVDGEYQQSLAYNFYPDRSSNQEDTYTPSISGGGWTSIPLDTGTRIRVTAFDEDLVNDDAAGIAEIGFPDLKAALDEGKVFHVNVSDQTQNRLLFVSVSVR